MKSAIVFLGTILCCLGFCSRASAAETIHFESVGDGFLVVNATINGKNGRFLFDTGSGFSNVTPQFAKAMGCKPWGQITGYRMTGQALSMQRCNHADVQIGSIHLSTQALGVFDIGKFVPPKLGHIDGTIALDLFAGKTFTFSYAGHFLTVLSPTELLERTRKLSRVPVQLSREASGFSLDVNLPVTTSEGTAWFEMDSGNTSGAVIVGVPLAKSFGLDPSVKKPQKARITLSNGLVFSGNTLVMPLILDGNLGTTFLKHYDVTLDLDSDKAWFKPHS